MLKLVGGNSGLGVGEIPVHPLCIHPCVPPYNTANWRVREASETLSDVYGHMCANSP